MATYSSYKPGLVGVASVYAGTDTAVNSHTGSVTVWNTSTLQSVTSRGNTTTNQIVLTNNSVSTGTTTGALIINGGVGIGGNLNVGGSINASALYSGGNQVLTTASTVVGRISSLIAGTDTAIVASSTVATIWNTSTLQSVTSRGNQTNFQITITNGTISTSASSGALIVSGGVGVGGNLWVNGYITGTNYLYANTATFNGTLTVISRTASNSTYSGALIVNGGIGVGGQINASSLKVYDNTTATVAGAGNIITAGGVYIGNNLVVMSTASNTGTANGNALYVAGGIGVGGSIVVNGNALFKGNTVFQGSLSQSTPVSSFVSQNILEIHTPPGGTSSTWSIDDGADIGIRFRYFNSLYGSTDSSAALVLAHDTNNLEWYSSNGGGTNNIVNGVYGTFKTANVLLVGNQNAVSTTSGSLQVAGGVSAGQDIFVGGKASIQSTLDATNNSGALRVLGGASIAKTLYIGSSATINSALTNNSVANNALSITGGLGVGQNAYIAGTTYVGSINNSLSTNSNQALLVNGGVGIGGNLAVSGQATVNGSAVLTTASIISGIVTTILAGTDTAVFVNNNTTTIWSTSTLQSVTNRGSITTNNVAIGNGLVGNSTNSGQALIVNGGVGATAVYALAMYDNNTRVITSINPIAGTGISVSTAINSGNTSTFTITNIGVTSLTAGTGLSITTSTGPVTITNVGVTNIQGTPNQIYVSTSNGNVTLSLPNGFSFTASNLSQLFVTGTNIAVSTTTGALQVVGGVGIGADIYVGSTATIQGSIIKNGNVSAANWSIGANSINGVGLSILPAIYTETVASGSYLNNSVAINSFGIPTVSNSSASIVYGDVATVYIDGAPSAGNNVTITNPYGLIVNNGPVKFTSSATSYNPSTGALIVGGGLGVAGDIRSGGAGQFSSAGVVIGATWMSSLSASYNSTSTQVVDTYSTSTYRTAKYLIQMLSGSSTHVTEIVLFHDNTNVYKSEYGIIYNIAELGSFGANFNNGAINLLFQPYTTSTINLTAMRSLISS